jgi:type 1 glutamine amidotransferase
MAVRRSFIYRFLRALLVLAGLLVALAIGFIWYAGAWNILFPSTEHETVAPALPADLESPAILVFSKTNGFRHKDGIAAGNQTIEDLASARGWSTFITENGAVFNTGDLARFEAVVFSNATGDVLSDEQERAFQQWLEGGGGWLGIHAAGDGSHAGWSWYIDNLIGADFTAHIMGPQFQNATVVLENQQHPVLENVPDIWEHREEWYSWAVSPRSQGFTILATLDEGSYSPVQKILGNEVDLSMGDHPVVWSRCVGQGRAVYTAMGHKAEAFDNPQFRKLLGNALAWITGQAPGVCD